MTTLHDRLAELADHAPTGGATAAELWSRGRRAGRLRVSALAATFLVVVAGIGVGIPELLDDRTGLVAQSQADGITLPIEYPVGQELPDLGSAPGLLAAVWLAPRDAYTLDDDDPGPAPEVVGLVAETGQFGTLAIDLSPWIYEAPNAALALSPDGRRIAYVTPGEELVVRDLVSGAELSPDFAFAVRAGATWLDATQLLGYVAGGSDGDGWVWKLGGTPERVDPYPYLERAARTEPPFSVLESDPPWSCESPEIAPSEPTGRRGESAASVLCDDLGGVGRSILLGHDSSGTANDLGRAVVAVDAGDGADFPFDDPALRRVIVAPGAPYPVAFATDLIAAALDVDGGAPHDR